MSKLFIRDHDAAVLEREWNALQRLAPEALHDHLAMIVEQTAPPLVERFYRILEDDEDAGKFLSHEMVQSRLRHTLRGWLQDLFPRGGRPDFMAMAERQTIVGEIHARINLPLRQVYRAWRMLNAGVASGIVTSGLPPETVATLLHLSSDTMNIAVEIMGAAYARVNVRAQRNEEAYRLFSLGQNLAQEREAQRAAIAEWVQNTLFAIASEADAAAIVPLRASEFGLWLSHRGSIVFSGMAELGQVSAAVDEVDDIILPAVRQRRDLGTTIARLQARINAIKSLLGECFNAAARIEGGRDPLTRMLNRRFMDTVLARELTFSRQSDRRLSLVMIDLDHFKAVNDTHGHAGGDVVLKQCAEVVLDTIRIGDFVFRYGGEEFLVALVETSGKDAVQFAERVRKAIAATPIRLGDGTEIHITASIGVAEFNGHPDYMRLVNAADTALYQAKTGGRNQVRLAEV